MIINMNMKSKKLLKAIGGIDDKFIKEAAEAGRTSETAENNEYEKPVFVTVIDERTAHRGLIAAAACICAVIAAAVLFMQTDLFRPKRSIQLDELLPPKENIQSLELTTWVLSQMQNYNVLFDERDLEIADCLYGMSCAEGDYSLSDDDLKGDYLINIEYSSGEKAIVSLFNDRYCIFLGDGSSDTMKRSVFKAEGMYSKLLELSGKFTYEYKAFYQRAFPDVEKYNIIGADYLDGYAAELENRNPVSSYLNYSSPDDSFYLRLTLPDGRNVSAKIDGEQRVDSYYSFSGRNTCLFRLENDGEYIILQPVGINYEKDAQYQMYDVKFFSCNGGLYGDNALLVPYTRLENGEATDIFTVSDMIAFEKGNILSDVGAGINIEFDPKTLTASIGEYSSALQEFQLPDFKPAEDFFKADSLDLPQETDIEGLFDGSKIYYYEGVYSEAETLMGRLWAYDMETKEKELLAQGEALSLWKLYDPICVYSGYLYYYHNTLADNRQSPEICRIRLSDKISESVYKLTLYGEPDKPAVTKGRLYFTEYSGELYNDLYYIDLETAEVSLFKKQAWDPMPYKGGIVYTHHYSVYYSGSAKLKGCGGEYDGDIRLFDLCSRNHHWKVMSKYCSDGENLFTSEVRWEIYEGGKRNQNYLIMKYDEKEGLLPVAKTENDIFEDCVFVDGFIQQGNILFDTRQNAFYSLGGTSRFVEGNRQGDSLCFALYDEGETDKEFYFLTR